MTRLAATLCLVTAICGCEDVRLETQPDRHVIMKVVETSYTPSHHSSSLEPGMTMNGKLTFTNVSVSIPARHLVVLRNEKGEKFPVESEDMWNRFIVGDTVDVTVRDSYRVRYEKKDGKLAPVSKEFSEWQCVGAVKVEQ